MNGEGKNNEDVVMVETWGEEDVDSRLVLEELLRKVNFVWSSAAVFSTKCHEHPAVHTFTELVAKAKL